MSVIKSKRRESDFEVYSHWQKTESQITELLLRDFGYSPIKADERIAKIMSRYGDISEMTEFQTEKAIRAVERDTELQNWYMWRRRNKILDCMDDITKYIRMANTMYPQYREELIQRRIYQDKAIGQLNALLQYIQVTAEHLPIEKEKIIRFAPMISKEIALVKAWRKSDNKIAKNLKS